MTLRLVLFDFDGTLADSGPWMREVINDVARRYRFRTVSPTEIDELRGKDTRAILAELGVSTWKVPFIARHMIRKADKAFDDFAGTGADMGLVRKVLGIG